jgi:hypothetical protein
VLSEVLSEVLKRENFRKERPSNDSHQRSAKKDGEGRIVLPEAASPDDE